jgi:hypothetical protein
MNTFFITLTWFIVIALKAYIDYYQIEIQKKNIKHGFEILLVAIVAFFHQVLSGVNKIEEWELAGWILLFQTMSYWAFFDASLNLMRGKEVFYYGEDAASDRLFQKWGTGTYFMSKIFALVLMIAGIVQLTKI